MLLKNFATVSFGVLLSLKALADDKTLYSADLTRIESNKKKPGDEQSNYKVCSSYRVDALCAFDAAALGPTSQKTAVFGSKIAPAKLQSLLDIPLNDAYVFTAALDLTPELSTSAKNDHSGKVKPGALSS